MTQRYFRTWFPRIQRAVVTLLKTGKVVMPINVQR
jgi:hypothetical protein